MREPVIPQFDAETYLLWESRQRDRFDLHHGFVVAFAGGALDHSQIAFNVQNALARLFPEPCRTFGSGVKIRVSENTFFHPDAGVDCSGASGATSSLTSPCVVCEVLSPSTRAYDLVEKRTAYRSLPSLDAYLVVHSAQRRIEADLRDAAGG